MMRILRSRKLELVLLATASWLIMSPPAHAYLDPGTGSYVFQMLIAGLVGATFVIKTFWHRIRSFFGKRPAEEPEPTESIQS